MVRRTGAHYNECLLHIILETPGLLDVPFFFDVQTFSLDGKSHPPSWGPVGFGNPFQPFLQFIQASVHLAFCGISRQTFVFFVAFLATMSRTLALALFFLTFFPVVSPIHIDPRDLDAPFLGCYDYIIVLHMTILRYDTSLTLAGWRWCIWFGGSKPTDRRSQW